MKLLSFLFKTGAHKKLAELLWVDALTASVHEFSLLSGLPYATTHELLQRMKSMGLVQKALVGKATLFSSSLPPEEVNSLTSLLGKTGHSKAKPLTDFVEMNLPLVGKFPELHKERAQGLEDLLVKVVLLAKRNPTLLRTLPLLAHRLGSELDATQLLYWSKRSDVDRELGFILDLTAHLSREKKFSLLARKFKDKRWSKQSYFLEAEASLSGFQSKLVEQNTPDLAKKWFLKMNMGLDSFESMFKKFA